MAAGSIRMQSWSVSSRGCSHFLCLTNSPSLTLDNAHVPVHRISVHRHQHLLLQLYLATCIECGRRQHMTWEHITSSPDCTSEGGQFPRIVKATSLKLVLIAIQHGNPPHLGPN